MSAARILVVEDEALIADDLERTLGRLGYATPAVVGDGDRAIDAAASDRPSLVLMDIKLRGRMDGIDAARVIRERYDIPIVFLTSHSDPATLSRASTVRPHGYVMKPFDERDLRIAIELALHKHEVEQSMRTQERWFATTLASLADGVIATSPQLTVTFMNAAAEEMIGQRADAAAGQHIDAILPHHDDFGQRLPGPAATALASGQSASAANPAALLRADGTRVLIEDSAAPILGPSRELLGVVVVVRDVTERRDLEARVSRAERLASLGTMAAGLCHEINNPLTSVITNLGFGLEIIDDPDSQPVLRESLEDARDAAQRISAIVRSVRSFGHIDDDRCTNVDLAEVADAAVRVANHQIRPHARLEVELGAAPQVFADAGRLTQVVVNLLVNAAQAITPGDASNHRVRLCLGSDARGWADLEVADDGSGIDPAVLPRIFDPFFTTKGPRGGMGIGLSICHNIVAGFGGSIGVESELGVGTRFHVRLPPSAVVEIGREQPARARRAAVRRARILVIDDEESLLRALVRALGGDHDVIGCRDGREGMRRLLGPDAFDLVLCDVVMPDIDGIEVYDTIAVQRPEATRRFAFITGGATLARAREFLDRVGRPVLHKPFADLAELRERVDELLARE